MLVVRGLAHGLSVSGVCRWVASGSVTIAANDSVATRPKARTYLMETEKTKLTASGVAEPTRYVSVRQQIKATSQGVDGYGRPTTREWTIVRDGRDRPIAGDSDADMLSLTRIDAFTSAFTLKRAGRVVSTGTHAISRDGKLLTVTTTGINANGQTINDVAVFDKQ